MDSFVNKCRYCRQTFVSNSSFRRHVIKKHEGRDLPPCQKRGPSRKSTQPAKEVACQSCDKVFSCRQHLCDHRRTKHAGPLQRCQPSGRMRMEVEKLEFDNVTGISDWNAVYNTQSGVQFNYETQVILDHFSVTPEGSVQFSTWPFPPLMTS